MTARFAFCNSNCKRSSNTLRVVSLPWRFRQKILETANVTKTAAFRVKLAGFMKR